VEQVFFVFAGYSCFYQLLFVAILHTDFGKWSGRKSIMVSEPRSAWFGSLLAYFS
jgi:hypothetical protein